MVPVRFRMMVSRTMDARQRKKVVMEMGMKMRIRRRKKW